MSARFSPRPFKIAVALGGALLLTACDRHAEEAPLPPIRPVLSTVVEPKAEQIFGPFAGTVEPRYQSNLGFRAAGRIVTRDKNVGDRVTAGERLASLDQTMARLAQMSAEADLINAQAQWTNAAATQMRQRALIQTGSVAQAQVDTAVAGNDTAEARVNQAKANLQKAQEQFGYTELHADYDGVIAVWNAEVGQVVAAGQTVVTVARPSLRDAVFDVPDDLIGTVQPQAIFTVSLQSDPSVATQGQVREIAPQADASTRTRRVRLTLTDPKRVFRLGTTVTITLTRPVPPRIDLPASAVFERDGQSFVWLFSANRTAERRPVTIDTRNDGTVAVTSGLAKGDRVITAGVHSLSDAQPVKLTEQ
jgi:RND family efflux transporter MFP subunit